MASGFSIEIVEQGWLVPSEPDSDLCSHGRLRLIVGGHEVVADDKSYGISETALALLRTLRGDHTPTQRCAEQMVFHGCGTLLMMGCPIGADFSVRHEGGFVTIGDVVRRDTTNEAEAIHFAELSVHLSEEAYRREVVQFARQAREPFQGAMKRFADEFDSGQYRDFWTEFEQLLAESSEDIA